MSGNTRMSDPALHVYSCHYIIIHYKLLILEVHESNIQNSNSLYLPDNNNISRNLCAMLKVFTFLL